jgi:hypothetical protein
MTTVSSDNERRTVNLAIPFAGGMGTDPDDPAVLGQYLVDLVAGTDLHARVSGARHEQVVEDGPTGRVRTDEPILI